MYENMIWMVSLCPSYSECYNEKYFFFISMGVRRGRKWEMMMQKHKNIFHPIRFFYMKIYLYHKILIYIFESEYEKLTCFEIFYHKIYTQSRLCQFHLVYLSSFRESILCELSDLIFSQNPCCTLYIDIASH